MEHKRTRRAPPVSYAELPPKRNRTITAEAQAHMQQRRIESRAACATGTKKDKEGGRTEVRPKARKARWEGHSSLMVKDFSAITKSLTTKIGAKYYSP